MNEEEALDFLDTFDNNSSSDNSLSIDGVYTEEWAVEQNEKIINSADDMILDRFQSRDKSLSIKDIIAAKSEAFKQIRVIQGKGEGEVQLIPSQINIQIINN